MFQLFFSKSNWGRFICRQTPPPFVWSCVTPSFFVYFFLALLKLHRTLLPLLLLCPTLSSYQSPSILSYLQPFFHPLTDRTTAIASTSSYPLLLLLPLPSFFFSLSFPSSHFRSLSHTLLLSYSYARSLSLG